MPLFEQETGHKKNSLSGRLLVFIELGHPCHSSPFHVHGALYTLQSGWQDLWGWQGFKRGRSKSVESASLHAPPAAKKVALTGQSSRASPAALWKQLEAKLPIDSGWVPLVRFLEIVKKPKSHTLRYVDGKSGCSWTSPRGGAPRERIDWSYRNAPARGGGQGEGWLHCHIHFLKHVYMTEHMYT